MLCSKHFTSAILIDSANLDNRGRVRRHLQIGATSERLGAGLDSEQVQAGAQTLVVLKVREEVTQVTRVAIDRGLSNKAVHSHGAVGANPHIPRVTADGDSSNGRAGARDRARSAQSTQPYHDLVLLATIRR